LAVPRSAAAEAADRATMSITIPVSPGDLVDRITILEIKSEQIRAPEARHHVTHELDLLRRALGRARLSLRDISPLVEALGGVNRELWEIEDCIRDCERRQDFGPGFVELARSVYRRNDERARLKRAINEACGSDLREEKLYVGYGADHSTVG
jgi:Family of unknown function (DUF6165)